ncbi:T9SS type A sorting domain-containing protein [Flavobacterium sp.]|uniref:T9SS type A sorting domain-containing protein n=1 Tax=Flavobacterium sp. TaxID=239 RepID=UPI0039196C09
MNKFYFLIVFAFVRLVASAQTLNIPDANFKAKLVQASTVNVIALDLSALAIKIDTNDDGEIQQSEVLGVRTLFLDSSNISSFEGIQYFSNLSDLRCSNNLMTELNLCGTAVAVLFCIDNPNLTSIILKNNVISETIWIEPPFPPFWVWNLPSLQYVCTDVAKMAEAQMYFTTATTNTITFSSDCNISDCSSLLNSPNNVPGFTVSVYPNPANTKLNITLPQSINLKSISIYNTLGQLVQVDTNPTETIDVSGLKTGSYFIKIISDEGTASSKFIKQ